MGILQDEWIDLDVACPRFRDDGLEHIKPDNLGVGSAVWFQHRALVELRMLGDVRPTVVVVLFSLTMARPRLTGHGPSLDTPIEGLSGQEDGVDAGLFLQEVQDGLDALVDQRYRPNLNTHEGSHVEMDLKSATCCLMARSVGRRSTEDAPKKPTTPVVLRRT